MDTNERGNNIGMVAIITLAVLTIILLIGSIVSSIFMPQAYANVVYALGFKNSSLTSYEYAYTRSNNINDAYIWMMKSVGAGSNDTVIRAYETLNSLEDYEDFVNFVVTTNMTSAKTLSMKLSLSNEDNYLKGKYVEALIKTGKEKQAFDFAFEDMASTNVIENEYTYNFVLSYFISEVDSDELITYFTSEVVQQVESYIVKLYDKFYSVTQSQVDDADKLNYLVLGYRIVNILRNLNELVYKTNNAVTLQINIEGMSNYMATKMYLLSN